MQYNNFLSTNFIQMLYTEVILGKVQLYYFVQRCIGIWLHVTSSRFLSAEGKR